jgi:hypothetical protein
VRFLQLAQLCTSTPQDNGAGDHPDSANKNTTGDAEPDFGSPHAKLHLLERVSVDCPWRAWHNLNTGRI